MTAASSAIERDAWRLFDVDFLAQAGGLPAYLDRILGQLVDWFGASSASIFLREGSSDDYRFVAGEGGRKGIIRAGTGIAGVVAETGEAVLVNDPGQHPLLKGRVGARREQLASSIVVPLTEATGNCIGVLNLSRASGLSEFDRRDLDRVRSVARQVSLAVVNARLFAEVAEAVAETERAKEKLQAVLKSLGVAVLVLDESQSVRDWNDRAESLFGARHGVSLTAIQPAEIGLAVQKALKSNEPQRARSADGRSWSITATSLSGGATATIEETTAYDQAQAEMDRLKRLAEVGQMTAAIAHEIRNPLTGIRSAAQLIAENPDQAEEFAGIIDQEVMKLNSLCEQFLEFARPLSLRLAPMNLTKTVRAITEWHSQDFQHKQVRLQLEIEPDAPTILADALRLEQVARNLLLNALQACRPGGAVKVSVGERFLVVEDDGCGISAEDQQKLFTPFFTTKPSGTGLGLSNLRKIVDAHGGQVSVTSEPGKGSRFAVSIPVEVSL